MSGVVDGLATDDLAAAGLLAHPSAEAEVVERTGIPGSADPVRVLASRVLGGFEHEVIASRGLDIGYASWRGVPISWRSPVQDARALDQPAGTSWLARFTGGLLTTCGPFGIGAAHGTEGLHGDFSHRPGMQVAAQADGSTRVSGVVEAHRLFASSLTVGRTITSTADADGAQLSIVDVVHNTGPGDARVAMLYHLNLGAPIVTPGTRVSIDARKWTAWQAVAEVPDPSAMPPACDRIVEAVFEHHEIATDGDGWARAVVRRPGSRLILEVAWKLEELPYLYQWVYPTRGRWALAIEPACAPLFGPARESAGDGAQLLQPGSQRRHEIIVSIREATA